MCGLDCVLLSLPFLHLLSFFSLKRVCVCVCDLCSGSLEFFQKERGAPGQQDSQTILSYYDCDLCEPVLITVRGVLAECELCV